jgi:hypothetical protein
VRGRAAPRRNIQNGEHPVWRIAVGFGTALIILGVAGYLAADVERRSFTALIPAIFGAVLIICGLIARMPNLRMHAMHVAAVIGLVGFAMPAYRAIFKTPSGLALFSQVAMAVLCLAFVVACVRSFVAARRSRTFT